MRFVNERMIARLPKRLEETQQDASLAREKPLLQKDAAPKEKRAGHQALL
jgi:hypothetical protein